MPKSEGNDHQSTQFGGDNGPLAWNQPILGAPLSPAEPLIIEILLIGLSSEFSQKTFLYHDREHRWEVLKYFVLKYST